MTRGVTAIAKPPTTNPSKNTIRSPVIAMVGLPQEVATASPNTDLLASGLKRVHDQLARRSCRALVAVDLGNKGVADRAA
jgi:hypothetical protein